MKAPHRVQCAGGWSVAGASLRRVHRRHQHGLSVVELMVGLAVGLLVTAIAVTALAQQLAESRRLLVEARLTHDLRVTAELMARHLRRAGHWGGAVDGLWNPGEAPPASRPANPHGLATAEPALLRFTYSSPADGGSNSNGGSTTTAVAARDHFGFRVRDGILDLELGENRWQALTDPATLQVTDLRIVAHTHDRPVPGVCPGACAPGTGATCPPRAQVQWLDVAVDATAGADVTVARQVRTQVRLRNDRLTGRCAP